MARLTFDFEESRSNLVGKIYRPIAQVYFHSRQKDRWYEVWMIVDSGADYTLLPKYFAYRLGVDLGEDCKAFQTAGVGGTEKVYFLKRIKAKLGNWERNVPVGFLSRDDIPPLLGRYMFLETFDVLLKDHKVTFSDPNGSNYR